ncbi:MAG: polyphenol oxidase family protein, partial [Candidatus Sericytochromatia bacterium]|nr:polyphenol oxidase family protein [Candidatus Tanganyikabacteria bacterium]
RCCYEVGDDVVDAFEQIDPTPARDDKESWIAQGPRRSHVDPPVMIRRQLRSAGVPAAQIHASGLCTLCRADLFFSYRRDGQESGRLVSVVQASR